MGSILITCEGIYILLHFFELISCTSITSAHVFKLSYSWNSCCEGLQFIDMQLDRTLRSSQTSIEHLYRWIHCKMFIQQQVACFSTECNLHVSENVEPTCDVLTRMTRAVSSIDIVFFLALIADSYFVKCRGYEQADFCAAYPFYFEAYSLDTCLPESRSSYAVGSKIYKDTGAKTLRWRNVLYCDFSMR